MLPDTTLLRRVPDNKYCFGGQTRNAPRPRKPVACDARNNPDYSSLPADGYDIIQPGANFGLVYIFTDVGQRFFMEKDKPTKKYPKPL